MQTVRYGAKSRKTVVIYDQPILYRDRYLPFGQLYWLFSPKTAKGTLNELLICLGLARFQDANDQITGDIRDRLQKAQREYDIACRRGYYRRDLSLLVDRPELLYWDDGRYRANINYHDYDVFNRLKPGSQPG
ncbi:MAG: hypothetical protein IPK83_22590 [Planctomycetes bacterium]|nr:hypothetical protein [Planctomycetota bacterium]